MLDRRHITVNSSKIYVIESVPDQPSSSASVVFVAGLGGTALGWVPVLRLLPASVRSFAYDRLGLSHSDRTDLPRPAAVLARELKATLEAAHVPGPYLLVLHSYAGIIGREFLQAFDSDVAGIVYVDANQENSQRLRKWPLEAHGRVASSIFSTDDATGLAQGHKCTPEDWADIEAEEAEKKAEHDSGVKTGGGAEWDLYEASLDALGKHGQLERQALGARPLSVIQANLLRDFSLAYAAGKAAGRGTPEDHALVDDFCARLPAVEYELNSGVLKLSSLHRMIITSVSGHMVSLWEPELVAQEVMWCLERA